MPIKGPQVPWRALGMARKKTNKNKCWKRVAKELDPHVTGLKSNVTIALEKYWMVSTKVKHHLSHGLVIPLLSYNHEQ